MSSPYIGRHRRITVSRGAKLVAAAVVTFALLFPEYLG